jgi:predicted SAM-dependent methyltransferase
VFLKRVDYALEHYKNFIDYNQLKSISHKYYEFGAGQTLIIPLTMTFLGFEVFCIDIRKLIITELINDSIEKFKLNEAKFPFNLGGKECRKVEKGYILLYLKDTFGLNYYAPRDAKNTGFEDNSYDFISSTATIEHIPVNDILIILKECYRILNVGGILSLTMDYQDQWSYFDRSISIYNFLKFSSQKWKKYNPSLHYQNRLRHSEYLNVISQTDFKIVKESPRFPNDEDQKVLRSIDLADEFKNFDFNDLAIKGSNIVLVK